MMEDARELRWYFSVIRRWLWLIVLCVLLGATAGFLLSSLTAPAYRASTSLLVKVGRSTDNDYANILASEHLATTYKDLLIKRPVIDAAAQTLDLDPSRIEEKVQVRLVPNTSIIELTVEDKDPRLAMAIADGIVAAFMRISRESGSVRDSRDLVVVEPATRPLKPTQGLVQPRALKNTALAGAAGAMLAVGIAFLVEFLDDTIKTPDDVRQTLGLDSIGAIGRFAKGDQNLIVATQPYSPVAEAFRVLGTNIRISSLDSPLQTILVTSPGVSDGKSIVVANLALAIAQAGLHVVAVDADLRRPRLGQLFGLDSRTRGTGESAWWGLTGALLEGRTDGRLQPVQVDGLRFLPTGELPPNPAELVGSQHMQKLLAELAQQADVVLIDSPPVLPLADATALAPAVDGVLLVLEAGKTRRQAARDAVERLRQVEADIVGAVLNAVPHRAGRYYEYYGIGSRGKKHRQRR